MEQRIALVTLIVDNYDRAVAYYTGTLGFTLIEDSAMDAGKRWVVVAPQGSKETGLLLAQAADGRQEQVIGSQAGGRVFLFLHTDDFHRDYATYRRNGVMFLEQPRTEAYGTVAVFLDLYGNRWDLIEPKAEQARHRPGALRGQIPVSPEFDGRSPDMLTALEGEAE